MPIHQALFTARCCKFHCLINQANRRKSIAIGRPAARQKRSGTFVDHLGRNLDSRNCLLRTMASEGSVKLTNLARSKLAGMLDYAAATASRHVRMADARKARCVLAEMRWR